MVCIPLKIRLVFGVGCHLLAFEIHLLAFEIHLLALRIILLALRTYLHAQRIILQVVIHSFIHRKFPFLSFSH